MNRHSYTHTGEKVRTAHYKMHGQFEWMSFGLTIDRLILFDAIAACMSSGRMWEGVCPQRQVATAHEASAW
jgi:hypothetical protein